MRLIDADLLHDLLERQKEMLYSTNRYSDGSTIGLSMAQMSISIAPTVEAVPLPCKVGDEVWCIRDTKVYQKPVKGTVTEIYFRDNMDMCIVVRRLCRGRCGESVFATEQETQAAIDRRVNDGKM